MRLPWDFLMDPEWKEFAHTTRLAARAVRALAPNLCLVLGGLSPVDPEFVTLLRRQKALEDLDVVAVHTSGREAQSWASAAEGPGRASNSRRTACRSTDASPL